METLKSMKYVCNEVGLTYETLKYYCIEGLVPNHKRDAQNHRKFSEKDIAWIKGLICLRKCGMSIKDMKKYMHYCIQGKETITQRKAMLSETKAQLENKLIEIQNSLAYIETKQNYYDAILAGELEYTSNLQ